MNQRQKNIRPIFHDIPSWMGSFRNRTLTPNNPEFHFYATQNQQSQSVTLQIPDENEIYRPIKMYYNIQRQEQYDIHVQRDASTLKDFSGLSNYEAAQYEKIEMSKEQLLNQSSWVRKYEPKRFFDLLTDELHNRNVITWLKSWDEIVFKRKAKKTQATPTLFKKGLQNIKPNGFIPQQYNYKKLILLAGPPGCGKTTLARVVAKHCGYHYQEINASDDRSGKTLITKIDNLVTNKTVGREQKPVCVIIDQVDGALDSQSNGIKQVLNYIQTGKVTGQKLKLTKNQKEKKQTKTNNKANADKQEQKKKVVKTQPENQKDQRKSKLDRPIIFICNDPYVKGLKQLRGKAIVVYFNPLQEERVVKRLKEITEEQGVYVQTQLLSKISQMCNNDVRSCVSILQMIVKFKKQQGINPKDFLHRLKFSFVKDTTTSTNEFMIKLNSGKPDDKKLFLTYQNYVLEHDNPTILCQTFFQNLTHHKHVFFRLQNTNKLYQQLLKYDIRMKSNFGQHDQFSMLLYTFFRIKFKHDEHKKFQFPSNFFQRLARFRNNQAILEKIIHGFLPIFKTFAKKQVIIKEYLYLLWLTLQTSSTREEDVLRCVYKMLTYGFKLAHRGGQFLFTPEIDQLLTFGANKPQISLSNTTRTLMQQNYQFLKMKSQLLVDCLVQGRQNYEDVINQLKRNRRRIRHSQGGVVKYKYLEGTGTQIKYDINISYFFQRKVLA